MVEQIKVLELFGGIGACTKAIKRLGIPYEIADYVEIDKYAVKSFNAIHGTSFEPQDIKEWNKDIEADLIMHGSPCQDFSVAGKGAGGDKGSGTRSSLMYETLRIVEKIKPKYVIWENVKNLLSKKHIHNFEAYQEAMKELGYVNYYQVLNAKDYGIPQNRERVFTVSIREDICDNTFKFPEKMVLEKKLKDILDDEVDEKYYIEDVSNLTLGTTFDVINGGRIGKMLDISRRAYHTDGIAPAVHTCGGGNQEPKIIASRGRGEMNEQHLGPRKDGLTNTITSVAKDNYVAEPNPIRIRKLTPKECWRLMGFDDLDFEKAEKVNSNSQLYKQAGNSIVVNVLEGILRNLIKEE